MINSKYLKLWLFHIHVYNYDTGKSTKLKKVINISSYYLAKEKTDQPNVQLTFSARLV